MIDALTSNTVSLVKLALDVAQSNQQLLANNIANINAENASRLHLNFSEIFSEQLKSDVTSSNIPAIEEVKYGLTTGEFIETSELPISLEEEMLAMTDNVIRYRTLLNALSSRGEIMKMAIQMRSA